MLALSNEALPRRSLDQLAQACRSRGVDGIELAVDPEQDFETIISRAVAAPVIALRVPYVEARNAPTIATAARVLRVPVSVAAAAVESVRLDQIVAAFETAGARLLLAHGSDLDSALSALAMVRTRNPDVLGVAWEVEPSTEGLDAASAVLFAVNEHLGLVRLHGGAPEHRYQDGRGIGAVLGELALAGYAGPIVLCPSSRDPEILRLWERWADSRGGSGCGHAVSAREQALDMRDVEPRNRFETIMGAYHTLIPGATLRLTLDHDPTCMYYTLEATEPPHSFEFRVVENGPEVWRAEVTKR